MRSILFFLAPLLLWGNLEHASISAYAVDCKTGKVVLSMEADKSRMPASCMKVVTTAAALHLLGPDYQFKTELAIDGPIQQGVLQGNLIIRGGGDPCLGSDRTSAGWEKQIEAWVAVLQEKGIKAIAGEVIGDDSAWEKAQAPASWAWEDLGNYYGAGASALTFNENKTVVTFKPGSEEGVPAKIISVVPAAENFVIQNEVTTGPVGSGDRACIYGSEYSMTQFVRGTVPAGKEEFSIKGSIPDPARLCSELLSRTLQKKGIKVVHQKRAAQDRQVIHTTLSPKVSEIVYWTNQKSVNLYAEHLIKAMGRGTTTLGTKAAVQFCKETGVPTGGMNMVDGSGLSRKNFITAEQLAMILVEMKKSPHFPHFLQSLPEEMPGVFAKSGSMSFTRCLAGYKGDIAFAILINYGDDSKEMEKKLDQLVTELH